MKSLNYTLSLFDYAKIASLIKYKAEYAGIPIYDILPAGTSQNCAKCVMEKGLDESQTNYARGKEKINGKPRMTHKTKVGCCDIHGQIDADLNAARVIALCLHKNIHEPVPFGSRKVFKRR